MKKYQIKAIYRYKKNKRVLCIIILKKWLHNNNLKQEEKLYPKRKIQQIIVNQSLEINLECTKVKSQKQRRLINLRVTKIHCLNLCQKINKDKKFTQQLLHKQMLQFWKQHNKDILNRNNKIEKSYLLLEIQ